MSTKALTKVSIMIVLVFLGTFIFKMPVAGGYCHLGDGMIFLGAVILGSKKGAAAGGIGAALADLLSGYPVWIIPTLLIKTGMVLIMGIFAEKIFPDKKPGWLVGAVAGGLFQIIGYTVAEALLIGIKTAIVDIPGQIIQTGAGIVIAGILIHMLQSSGFLKRLKEL